MTLAFLAATAALDRRRGHALRSACDGCPPVEKLLGRTPNAAAICSSVRSAPTRASLTSRAWWRMLCLLSRPRLWQWIGDDDATVFSY